MTKRNDSPDDFRFKHRGQEQMTLDHIANENLRAWLEEDLVTAGALVNFKISRVSPTLHSAQVEIAQNALFAQMVNYEIQRREADRLFKKQTSANELSLFVAIIAVIATLVGAVISSGPPTPVSPVNCSSK